MKFPFPCGLRNMTMSTDRIKIIIVLLKLANIKAYVSVKSKLKHPPPGIPRAFNVFSCPRGGNLMNLVFPGAGNLITTHNSPVC